MWADLWWAQVFPTDRKVGNKYNLTAQIFTWRCDLKEFCHKQENLHLFLPRWALRGSSFMQHDLR